MQQKFTCAQYTTAFSTSLQDKREIYMFKLHTNKTHLNLSIQQFHFPVHTVILPSIKTGIPCYIFTAFICAVYASKPFPQEHKGICIMKLSMSFQNNIQGKLKKYSVYIYTFVQNNRKNHFKCV